MVDMAKLAKKGAREASKVLRSLDYSSIVFYLAVLLLVAGAFYSLKGLYALFGPQKDAGELHFRITMHFPGAIGALLGGELDVKEVNAFVPVVYRYDSASFPGYKAISSPWDECTTGLVMSFIVEGDYKTTFGPYCFPGSIESLLGLDQTFEWVFLVPPGSYNVKVFVTYNGQPVFSKTYPVSVPSYEDVSGGEGAG